MAHSTLPVLTHPEFPQVLTPLIPGCTVLDCEGYECGDPAVIQILPVGDDALCLKHLRRANLLRALEEVSR